MATLANRNGHFFEVFQGSGCGRGDPLRQGQGESGTNPVVWAIMDLDGRRQARAPLVTVLATAGGIIVLAVALGLLYLAFRGPSSGGRAAIGAAGPSLSGSLAGVGTASAAAGDATSPATVHPGRPASSSPHASPLGAAAQSYVDSRSGAIRVAVYDLATGQEWSLGNGAAQPEASVVKVDILEALLAQRPQGLTADDQSLAQQMIEDSDNDAATSLWDLVGGGTGVGAYNARAGLRQTTPSSCVVCSGFPWPGWGLTTTTPQDQIVLLRRLVEPGGALTASERQYALSLMENVTQDQQWGVSSGVPAGMTVALKNGWLPLDEANDDWQINSVGWVDGGGRDYLLAMLSSGNPSEQYGIDTLNSLGATVWQQMGN
jgi:beta-lactamase class A